MLISVFPTLASADSPKPRKMSPTPQMAKLSASAPNTTVMMDLPIRPEEAFLIPLSMGPVHGWDCADVDSQAPQMPIIKIALRRRNILALLRHYLAGEVRASGAGWAGLLPAR